MEIYLKIRRFRCGNRACIQRTFAEQHSDVVSRRSRRTNRLVENLTQIGVALGGQGGARLAEKLQMPVSGSTILRLLRKMTLPSFAPPRIIGIDDWAFCKGKSYGTIIVDLESRQPIDLLPSRESKAVKAWLTQHPHIELVTRDRFGDYKNAITEAAPQAIQVVDRWHLIHNLFEAMVRYLSRRYKAICQLALLITHDEVPVSLVKNRRYDPGPERLALQAAREHEREERFNAVKACYAQGAYITDIAKEFNLSRPTIMRWLDCDSYPGDARGRFKRVCIIDKYVPYLEKRLAQGCRNQSQLWREIQKQGFSGTRSLVSRWIRQQGHSVRQKQQVTKAQRASMPRPIQLASVLLRHDEDYSDKQKEIWGRLQQDNELVQWRELACQFLTMLRQQEGEKWPGWVKRCLAFSAKELRNLVLGFMKDEAAVRQAIMQCWSNGQVEGHVNRLKYLKRQMYGRANFDLLRLRVLAA